MDNLPPDIMKVQFHPGVFDDLAKAGAKIFYVNDDGTEEEMTGVQLDEVVTHMKTGGCKYCGRTPRDSPEGMLFGADIGGTSRIEEIDGIGGVLVVESVCQECMEEGK